MTPDKSASLPANVEAEAALLGALMLDNRLIDDLAEQVGEEDFFEPVHGRIYSAILSLRSQDMVVTPITLHPLLHADEGLQRLDGISYLGRLTGSGAGLIGARQFARQIHDLALHRAVIGVGRSIVDQAMDTSEEVNPRALIENAEALLAGVDCQDRASNKPHDLGKAWWRTLDHVRAVAAGTVSYGAMIAGLTEWNDITGGMSGGQLLLLGGRPGMGKTDLALAIARRAAEAGHGVLFISREMNVDALMLRIVADMLHEAGSRVTFDDLRLGRVSDVDYRLAADIGVKIEGWPLTIEETPSLNAASVRAMIRSHQRRFAKLGKKLALVVIDYVGLLDAPRPRGNREQEMSDISKALKDAARACDVPILALAQLNRSVEQREDKRPVLSDLRDSGSLEQDADAVIFVYRHEYYLRQAEPPIGHHKRDAWESDMTASRYQMEVYAAKSRQIEPQRRKLLFFGANHAVRGEHSQRAGGHQ